MSLTKNLSIALMVLILLGAVQSAMAQGTNSVIGVWQQASSNYLPCNDCYAYISSGYSSETKMSALFYTDACAHGWLELTADGTQVFGGELTTFTREDPGIPLGVGTVKISANGGRMYLTISPPVARESNLVNPIEETYRYIGPESSLTPAQQARWVALAQGDSSQCLRSPSAEVQQAFYAHPHAAGELPATGNLGELPATGDLAIQTQPSPTAPSQNNNNANAAQDLALGLLGIGAAIVANEVADQFFDEAPAPSAPTGGQGPAMDITLSSIQAVETTFGFGGDEIFLLFSDGTRFPADPNQAQSIDGGQSWSPNARIRSNGGISVDLREWDSFNASDVIGTLTIGAGTAPGRYTSTLRGDGAEYVVTYDVAMTGQAAQHQQQQRPQVQRPTARVWASYGTDATVTVTDCRDDCEEDLGLVLMCQGYGQRAIMSLNWLAQEFGPEGDTLPVNITVDGRVFPYTAVLGPNGLVGHVPSIAIESYDPIIEALQAGNLATVGSPNAEATIGLRGSRRALDSFKNYCGWNDVAQFDTAPVVEETPFWFVSNYTDFQNNTPTTSLTYGVPETDAIGFLAYCQTGAGQSSIGVDLIADFGNLPNGASTQVYLQTSTMTQQYPGRVFVSSEEWAGIHIDIAYNDPIWRAIASEQTPIYYGIGGLQPSSAGVLSANIAISDFLAACGAPQQPAIQRPSLPAQQPVAQPQQPRIPATLGTQNYVCDDGSRLSIGIVVAGAVSVANVMQNGVKYDLIKVPTQAGEKYSNGQATLNVSGSAAQFSANGGSLFCQAGTP